MTQDTHKHYNFTRNIYRPVQPKVIEIDWTRYNSTPKLDDKPLKELIRSQITPFQPEPAAPKTTPLATIGNSRPMDDTKKTAPLAHPANHRRVIDFQSAIISEPEKWHFIHTMMELCERLSAHFDTPIYDVNEAALYALFSHYSWTCPVSGKVHSWKTPLTIEFLKPVWLGGKIQLSNMRPIYNGWLPGEYRWAGQPTLSEMAAA